MEDCVAHCNSSAPDSLSILIAVEEVLQSSGEESADLRIPWLNMDICNVTGAIGVCCRWHDESRGQQIAHLDTDVVLAVSKGRQLHDAGKVNLLCAEHLREDGMRHRNVEALGAGIGDADSNVVHS